MHARNTLAGAARRCKRLPIKRQQHPSIQSVLRPQGFCSDKNGFLATVIRSFHDKTLSIFERGKIIHFSRGLASSSSADPHHDEDCEEYTSVTSSIHGEEEAEVPKEPLWNTAYRAKVDKVVFGVEQESSNKYNEHISEVSRTMEKVKRGPRFESGALKRKQKGAEGNNDKSAKEKVNSKNDKFAKEKVKSNKDKEQFAKKGRIAKEKGKLAREREDFEKIASEVEDDVGEEEEDEIVGEMPLSGNIDDLLPQYSGEEREWRASEVAKALASLKFPDENNISESSSKASLRKAKGKQKKFAKEKENIEKVNVNIANEFEEEEEEEEEMQQSDKASDDWSPQLSPQEKEWRSSKLAKALLEASLEQPDDEREEEEGQVRKEDQKSLSVGIIGPPNAGKSTLTNYMVGSKVAAVSRKTNTTTHEILGVLTRGNTQILFFDTPGIGLNNAFHPYKMDVRQRVESAWTSIELYDLLIVIIDAHRHLIKSDSRVVRLINHLGKESHPRQKRILCMNKVDLVKEKKDLLKVASEFGHLPGYDKFYMISGMKGSGLKDLVKYLMEQAVRRPWDEDPMALDEDFLKSMALEIVREKLLHYIHQEIPYKIDHRMIDWKEMEDGSLRIEQHFIVHKHTHRRIIIGKNGSKIREIGMAANEELRTLLNRTVHLIIQVRLKS